MATYSTGALLYNDAGTLYYPGTGPYAVVVGTPATGQIAPSSLVVEYDSNSYANRVYVQGGNPAGSGFVQDQAAITAANGLVRTASMSAPDCTTAAMRNSLGAMYLGRVSRALVKGTFTTWTPYDGWRAGQDVSITEPDLGWVNKVFRVTNVTTRFEKLRTGYQRLYEIQFGAGRETA